MLARMLALLAVPWFLGCTAGARGANADGGDGSLATVDALAGRHSFDVVAVLSTDGSSNLPPTNSFTLVLDVDARLAIVGGNGRGAVIGVTTSDGRTFRSAGAFTVGSLGGVCTGPEDVRYDDFEVTIAGGSLSGSARGIATISCGDCSFTIPFGATLTGTSDATPPGLRAGGLEPQSPFQTFNLVATEPMPASAAARLVADDGAAIDLVPHIVDGPIPLVVAFSKPNVVLRAGRGYTVALDGLVDFAGQSDRAGPPLRFASFVAAPAVVEDGFESVTGTTFGGAMVMRAGPLPAIAGNTSLYIGSTGAPALDSATGRSLMVRLSRQPGDTKLLFSYRLVASQPQISFFGTVAVGSEGASPAPAFYLIGDPTAPVQTLTVAGQTVTATAVAVQEAELPADATDEVLVVIAPSTVICSPFVGVATGLEIDDLRLE